MIVYYSSRSGNTERFIYKLDIPSERIPITGELPQIRHPYVLIIPTYSDGTGRGAVPKKVRDFLSEDHSMLMGVIAGGNRNFGEFFGYAGNVISRRFSVPLLYKFELSGTPEDVLNVNRGIPRFLEFE